MSSSVRPCSSRPARLLLAALTALSVARADQATPAPAGVTAEAEIFTLDPITVVGERYEAGAQKVAYISADAMETYQAADLHELFARTPSVTVGGGLPAAQKIYVRGIEDKLLNITVNGATQAGYLSHHQSQYVIEPELLRSVVVEPGAGGAANGAGALAGAIRIETKDADDFLAPGQAFGAFNKASYHGNGDGVKLTSALYGRLGETGSALAAFTWFDTGDYQDGHGDTVDYTAHTENRAFLDMKNRFAGEQEISLSYERLADEGTYRHRPNFAGYFNHPRAANVPVENQSLRHTITLDYEQTPDDADSGLAATTYFTDYTIDRPAQYEMGYQSLGATLSDTRTLGGDHVLHYGADARADTLSFTGKGTSTVLPPFNAPPFPGPITYRTIRDETVDMLGLFAQDRWSPLEALQIDAGLRADYFRYEDRTGQVYDDAGLSPNLGASYQLLRGLSVNASQSRAFRGVTPIDAITSNEGGVTNAAAIDPERAVNNEFGFQYQRGGLHLNATYYRQRVGDIIVHSAGVRDNAGTLRVEGYDFGGDYAWESFDLGLGLAWSDPTLNDAPLDDSDLGLGTASGRRWNLTAGWRPVPRGLRLGWTVVYAEAHDDVPAGFPEKPSYVVHHAFAQWHPLSDERLTVTFTVNNLFDLYYVEQVTSGYNTTLGRVAGLPEAGRDARLSVSYQF